MSNLKKQHQKPEGRLLETAMKRPPKLSARQLAKQVSMSEARVRQIVNGYRTEGAGQVIDIIGPAETVARFALAAGVTADELDGVGRTDAAEVLRSRSEQAKGDPEFLESLIDGDALFKELMEWAGSLVPGRWPPPPPTSALFFWSTEQMLEAIAEREQGHRENVRWHVDRYRKLKARLDALLSTDEEELKVGKRDRIEVEEHFLSEEQAAIRDQQRSDESDAPPVETEEPSRDVSG